MVETNRLTIMPLNHPQLELYLRGNNEFENVYQLTLTGRTVSSEIRERVSKTILQKILDSTSSDYLYLTFWIVVEKSRKNIVAELGFKGGPNENGEIEIGYATLHKHREMGYMTEAVGAMIKWAKQQSGLTYIIAETGENNLASIKVLQKNNFQFDFQKEKMKWWRIAVS
jgi:[ribosomal protein S5]-alanine N-acetyltransferase